MMKLKISKSRFLQNTSWIVGANIVQMIVSFVVAMISARYLGPSNYGIINYAGAIVSFFTSIASLGMEGVLVNEFTSTKYKNTEVLGTSLVMGLVSSVLSSIVVVILVGTLKHWDSTIIMVTFLQSLTLVFKAFNVFDYWFQSKLLSKYPSIIRCISYMVMSMYKIFLLITNKSVVWFAFSLGVDTLSIACGLVIYYFLISKEKILFNVNIIKPILVQSAPFIISGMVSVIYTQIDKIMIEQILCDSTQTGLYSAALTVCSTWMFLPQAFITSARPVILAMKHNNDDRYLIRLRQLYCFIIWGCIAVVVSITLFAPLIIYTLYGTAYIGAVKTLQIVIWYTIFSMIGTARGIWIICEKKNKYVWRYMIVGSVINVVLNATLIPIMGINGAALATVIAQFTSAIIAPIFFKETRIHTRYVLESFIFKGIK